MPSDKSGSQIYNRPKIFLDTSALFSAIWSDSGGGRLILKLGEAGLIQILVGSQVLSEISDVLKRKAPQSLPNLAFLLDRCQVDTVSNTDDKILNRSMDLVAYRADALVLAEAIQGQCDFFVTLDREHFIKNPLLPGNLPHMIGTPGDCIQWLRAHFYDLLAESSIL